MKWQELLQKEFDKMIVNALHKRGFLALVLLCCLSLVTVNATSAAASGMLPVPIVTIYPGDSISQRLLRNGRFSDQFMSLGGYVLDAEKLRGMVARRTLVRGRAIPENSVRRPYLVRNGQLVILRYQRGLLSIVAKAVSLKSGMVGDYIQARNIDTGRTVAGLVQNDGSLLVSLK